MPESPTPDVQFDVNFTLHQRDDQGDDDVDNTRMAKWKRVFMTILGFSGFWATCVISAVVALVTPLPWFQALCLPACLCLLALCWNPKVQVYIVRSHDGTFMGRWKATCLYTVFKIIILLVGLSIVMVIRLQAHGVMDKNFFFKLWDGLYACRHKEIFYPLIIHFSSSFSGHVLAYISTTLCFPGIGITMPTLVATPASVGILLYLCSPGFHWLDEVVCNFDGVGIWCACVLAGIVWLAPLVLKGPNLNKSSDIFMKPYDELFIQPAWNSIFLDQHLCLNYKHDGFEEPDPSLLNESSAVSRIFICTTMYREADFEMGRLLKSIRKVSQSKKLGNTYLEAHIFLDNGTNDTHLTDFASQLISLLESKLGVAAHDANAYIAPYGIQLNWNLPGGMPFFIHLKDSEKVKPKKRWSQVMYMSYVLNFRVMRDHSRDKQQMMRPRLFTHEDSMFVGYASDKEWEKNLATLNDEKQEPSPNPSANTNGTPTPFFIREPRKKLARMFSNENARHGTCDVITETYQSELSAQATSSSDQGIGNSDGLSVSSLSVRNDDLESSEADPSRQSTMRGRSQQRGQSDEGWQDYEGDISSNNENSLTSLKARKARDLLRDREKVYVDFRGDRPRLPVEQGTTGGGNGNTEGRPQRPKRHHTPHPPRHRHPSHQRASKRSTTTTSSALPVSPSSSSCMQLLPSSDGGGGNDNLGFDSSEPTSPASPNPPPTTMPPLPPRPNFVDPLSRTDSQIFTISRKTVPSKKSTCKKRIPLDDHTYILATDADMEFDDNSVVDLLNLCNSDRRLGGACGRTHPIGQKSGPLVWYQKFEYAKGEKIGSR